MFVQMHNGTHKPKKPHEIKAEIIRRYKSISRAAKKLKVHRNSIRLAWLGRCPGVLKRLG